MNQESSTKKSLVATRVSFAPNIVLWLVVAATAARADWPNANRTKYYQPPDRSPTSYNVLAAQPPAGAGIGLPLILADDFPCTETGFITDIHIWASWLGDTATANIPDVPITLGFWSDVPATPGNPSHPGALLWSRTFLPGGAIPGHYKKVPAGSPPSPFWNPDPFPAGSIMGNDFIVWQYNFYPDTQQPLFEQMGTAAAPTNYWLSVTAGANVVAFGWRTSAFHHGDDAVFGHLTAAGSPAGDWQELFDPQLPTRSLDLAFALTTTPTTPPPPPPPPGKWVQYPDLQSGLGLDVDATSPNVANGLLTLADDFQCFVVGPITNIQFWASFQGNTPPGANTFVVSIWSDGPKGSSGFSQPKQRLWTQTYNPGDYTFIQAGAGTEQFFDPITHTLSPESQVWLYSFDLSPANPFCQQGQGTVYWVSIAALAPSPPTPALSWGWKTSTNHWNDAGVFGKADLSGNLLVPWQPLFNPLLPAALVHVDFAFQINGGPPSSDCDPALGGVIQPPDTSNNGLDVWALTPTIVGDDFPCRISGPISGFTIWGSWLNDLVDSNANFQVTLWTDVPASVGNTPYSHPGSQVCSAVFAPPQTPGGALRYQFSLFKANVLENFYNPNIPGLPGLIGTDTKIWRYDFYPFVPSCFNQDGGPFGNNKIFWVTVSYLPGTAGTANPDVFGWKTSTKHFQDAAVFGNGGPWTPLNDPRSGAPLDLAKVVWKFPVTGINKDLVNNTTTPATGIQIILSGTHLITWHYDNSPPWLNFSATFDAAGNTVLQWSGGLTVPPGGINHVGFEMPGSGLPPIIGMNWLNGATVIGTPVQINFHLLGDPTAVEVNDFYPGTVLFGPSSVEYYATPPRLDQMVVGGARSPLATFPLADPGPVNIGGAATMSLPPSPPGAMYALILVALKDGQGNPGAMDFVLVPLDTALAPTTQSIGVSGGNVTIDWTSVYGRMYQLQSSVSIANPLTWINVGSPVMAVGADTSMTVPVGGAQSFYRIMLMP